MKPYQLAFYSLIGLGLLGCSNECSNETKMHDPKDVCDNAKSLDISVVREDFNNDSNIDTAVAYSCGEKVHMYLQPAHGNVKHISSFNYPQIVPFKLFPRDCNFGSIPNCDNTIDLELMTYTPDGEFSRRWHNDGTGNFTRDYNH